MGEISKRVSELMKKLSTARTEEIQAKERISSSETPIQLELNKAKLARIRAVRKSIELEAEAQLNRAKAEYRRSQAEADRAKKDHITAQAAVIKSRYDKFVAALGGGRGKGGNQVLADESDTTVRKRKSTAKSTRTKARTTVKSRRTGKSPAKKMVGIAKGVKKETSSLHRSLIDW